MEVIKDIEMKTKRLSLRRPNIHDKAFFVYLFNAPKVSDTYVCDSLKDEAVVEKWLKERIPNVPHVWVIEYEGKAVGFMNCFPSSSSDAMEVGYVIDPMYQNKGICTEAFKAVIDFLLDDMDCYRVVASHFFGNDASGRVMQKAGMWYEGIHYNEYLFRGKYESLKCYYITKTIRKVNEVLSNLKDDEVLNKEYKLYHDGIIDHIDDYKVYKLDEVNSYQEVNINNKVVKVEV